MTDKLELWEKLGKTDPAHTKQFKRAGGFSGTAIKPMWAYKRMTEEFGPCGKGWGVYEPTFQVVPGPEGEMLVYCTVSIWYEKPEQRAFGVGGDKAVGKNKYGLSGDDEAFKKAFTDAITNALKMIGVGADVHMGMFDDNKYVNTMREEFAGNASKAQDEKKTSAAEMKRGLAAIDQELLDCASLVSVDACAKSWQHVAKRDGWTKDYIAEAAKKFKARREAVSGDDFPGDREAA